MTPYGKRLTEVGGESHLMETEFLGLFSPSVDDIENKYLGIEIELGAYPLKPRPALQP